MMCSYIPRCGPLPSRARRRLGKRQMSHDMRASKPRQAQGRQYRLLPHERAGSLTGALARARLLRALTEGGCSRITGQTDSL